MIWRCAIWGDIYIYIHTHNICIINSILYTYIVLYYIINKNTLYSIYIYIYMYSSYIVYIQYIIYIIYIYVYIYIYMGGRAAELWSLVERPALLRLIERSRWTLWLKRCKCELVYTQFVVQDLAIFGPNPWQILRHYL